MKIVEFERIKSNIHGYGALKGSLYEFENIEKIIKQRIEDGWSFEGYVPVTTRKTGDIETLSLIFTKDE